MQRPGRQRLGSSALLYFAQQSPLRVCPNIATQVWMVIQIFLDNVRSQTSVVNQVAESMQSRLLTREAWYCDYAGERIDGFLVDFRIADLRVSTVGIILTVTSMVYRKIPEHEANVIQWLRAFADIVRTPRREQLAGKTLN